LVKDHVMPTSEKQIAANHLQNHPNSRWSQNHHRYYFANLKRAKTNPLHTRPSTPLGVTLSGLQEKRDLTGHLGQTRASAAHKTRPSTPLGLTPINGFFTLRALSKPACGVLAMTVNRCRAGSPRHHGSDTDGGFTPRRTGDDRPALQPHDRV